MKCLICNVKLRRGHDSIVQLPTITGLREIWAEAVNRPTHDFSECVRHSYICSRHFHPHELKDRPEDRPGNIRGYITGAIPHPDNNHTVAPTITVTYNF